MYHGLSAYNRFKGCFPDLLDRVRFAAENFVCWADEPLGPLGIFTDPENACITCGWNKDAYSYEDIHGMLVSDTEGDVWASDFESNFTFVKTLSASVDKDSPHPSCRYAEIHAKAEADAVWYNPRYGRKFYLLAKKLAYRLSLPLLERG